MRKNLGDCSLNSVEQLAAKDISNLQMIVDWSANILLTGTRSQRRPDLGKMTRRVCGHRRLQGADKCCNLQPATTRRAWDPQQGFHQEPCEPKENKDLISKQFIKKLQHKRHGQSRTNKLRALIIRFMADEGLLASAAEEMHLKVPDRASIPSFGQKFWLWCQEREDKKKRKQQYASRRINVRVVKNGGKA